MSDFEYLLDLALALPDQYGWPQLLSWAGNLLLLTGLAWRLGGGWACRRAWALASAPFRGDPLVARVLRALRRGRHANWNPERRELLAGEVEVQLEGGWRKEEAAPSNLIGLHVAGHNAL